MKKILLFLILALITINSYPQMFSSKDNNKFEEGYPNKTKGFFNAYNFEKSDVKTIQLNTGVDSLQVYFGYAKNKMHDFYWTAISNNDLLLSMNAGFMLNENKLNILTDTIELKLDRNDSQKTYYLLNLNIDTQTVDYKWINSLGNFSEKLNIIFSDNDKTGTTIPDLSFQLIDGKEINLSSFLGKTIVINWWHTRCGPCISEMPGLNSIVEKYSSNKNIIFLSVAHNTIDELNNFLKKRNFNYLQSVTNEESLSYFGKSYPKHFIINEKGIIEFYTSGGGKNTFKEIDKELKMVLNKK